MRNIRLILVIIVMSGCQPDNTDFYPFDNEFKFHQSFKLQDYDTIMGECGYWNLTRKENGLGIYYQFFLEEKTIVAKGFNLDIDEIPITLKDSLITEATLINLSKEHPIDIEYVKSKLSSFKIKDIVFKSPFGSYIEIELVDTKDSIYQASIMMLFENDKIVRQLSYFNSSERHR